MTKATLTEDMVEAVALLLRRYVGRRCDVIELSTEREVFEAGGDEHGMRQYVHGGAVRIAFTLEIDPPFRSAVTPDGAPRGDAAAQEAAFHAVALARGDRCCALCGRPKVGS